MHEVFIKRDTRTHAHIYDSPALCDNSDSFGSLNIQIDQYPAIYKIIALVEAYRAAEHVKTQL